MVNRDRATAEPVRHGRNKKQTRTERLRIRREDCVACAACPSVCHVLALYMNALQLALIEDLCDNCGACIPVCPVAALYFE